MSALLPAWPALAGLTDPPATPITWTRGIWGKVHGAASDYRWIARGEGLGAGYGDSELAAALRLGAEDTPVSGGLWRCLPDGHLAGAVYPSRARDSAGRLTVIEKQVAQWSGGAALPAALAALVLLPAVAGHDDLDWWGASADRRWAEPWFALPLPGGTAGADGLAGAIVSGCADLIARTDPDALWRCYATLLAGRVPALLPTTGPLTPLALAALLLPLPRTWADRLSLAGAVAARTLDPWDLRRNWDLIASPMAGAPTDPGDPELAALAVAIGAALRAADPGGLAARYAALGMMG